MTGNETAPPLVVVMGVSGCGKTTVGTRLAADLGVRFLDGDDLHPPVNVAKMANGEPLTDMDRWPWLGEVGRKLHEHQGAGLVVACSALRRAYRHVILSEAPTALFVHLHGKHGTIRSRLSARESHFMPAALLASQLGTLEPLAEDEPGFTVSIGATPDDITRQVIRTISRRNGLPMPQTPELP